MLIVDSSVKLENGGFELKMAKGYEGAQKDGGTSVLSF